MLGLATTGIASGKVGGTYSEGQGCVCGGGTYSEGGSCSRIGPDRFKGLVMRLATSPANTGGTYTFEGGCGGVTGVSKSGI